MLTGRRIGYSELAPNAAIQYHTKKHMIPSAPTAESPNEIAEVSMPQHFLTVILNTRQKQDDTASPAPIKPKAAGKPLNIVLSIKIYEGAFAPPIIPVAPLSDMRIRYTMGVKKPASSSKIPIINSISAFLLNFIKSPLFEYIIL